MPFVQRRADGTVSSLHLEAPLFPCEFLDDRHADVLSFVGQRGAPAYERIDADFIRVLEDLIDVLLRRQVINVTDLPAQAQRKLYLRKGHRKSMPLAELNLLGDQVVGDDGEAGIAPAPDFEAPR